MIPFATKLLMSGQLKFDQGQITIFDQRVLIFPMSMVEIMMEKAIKDEEFARSIYDAAKRSVIEFSEKVCKRLNITKEKEFLDILFKLTEMNGYGQIVPTKIDYESKTGVLQLKGLPSKSLFGKFGGVKTADIYWCGLVAGGLSHVFEADVDAIETRCVIDGKDSCEIVAGKPEFLQKHLDENGLPKPCYLKP